MGRYDDNTPQGKLGRGCIAIFWVIVAIPIFIGLVDGVAHGVCYLYEVDCKAWECGWFRYCP